jgi:putative ABC transport system permease protein
MYKNYLKIALRHLSRQKVLAFINIFGLSIAMGCCIWIYLFISDEVSFDRFHENADSIFSIIQTDNHYKFTTRQNPNALGPALKEYFPEIRYSVRIVRDYPVIRYQERMFTEQLAMVDTDFFSLFSFKLLQGNRETFLFQENSLVMTESMAEKYFPGEDPLGKIVTITFGQRTKDFLITGLLEEIPSNSTLQYELFVNIQNTGLSRTPEILSSWIAPQSHTFIQLKDGVDAGIFEDRMPSFIEQYMSGVIEERRGRGAWLKDGETIIFSLQNLKNMHLHSRHIGGGEGSDIRKSMILGGIGLLVLLIAGINFTNLCIARSSKRAVEIGMRKVLGADLKNLIRQFWSESVLTVFISMMIGLMLAEGLIGLFNRLADKNLSIAQFLTPLNLSAFVIFTLLVGLAAGSYPGLILSRFHPVETLRRRQKLQGINHLTSSLLIFQFCISIFLMIATLTMAKQVRFINTKDLGFDRNGIVMIGTQERGHVEGERVVKHFRNLALNESEIISVSGCTYPFSQYPGTGNIEVNGIQGQFLFSSVYYDYAKTMGMTLVEGRDFSEEFHPGNSIVVNQKFVSHFNIESPIGQEAGGARIIGVIEDYNYMTLHEEITPVIHIFNDSSSLYNVLVRISPQSLGRTLPLLEMTWKEIQPNKPFVYSFFDEDLALRYNEEKKWNSIVFHSSFLAILISCMGLIGITGITINKRTKEIGVRKVLGASIHQIAGLILSNFAVLILISNGIALPIAYLVMNRWLQRFVFRINMDAGIFLLAGVISFFVAISTIIFQILRAAKTNPVNSLRAD